MSSKMPELTDEMKEKWIDLYSLISCSGYINDKLCIFYQYGDNHPYRLYTSTTYDLRIALRSVGHKITKKITHMYDLEVVMIEYHTSITKEEDKVATKWWNEWVGETHEEEYTETDSEDESDSDEEENDNEDENPCV